MGSVRFSERYLLSDPVSDEEFWKCQEEIDKALETLSHWRSQLSPEVELLAVAGTAVTLASIHLSLPEYDRISLEQCELTRGDVHRLVEELKWRTVSERQQLAGIEAKRADVLLAGAMILWRSMELLAFKSCRISCRGLRYGALVESRRLSLDQGLS